MGIFFFFFSACEVNIKSFLFNFFLQIFRKMTSSIYNCSTRATKERKLFFINKFPRNLIIGGKWADIIPIVGKGINNKIWLYSVRLDIFIYIFSNVLLIFIYHNIIQFSKSILKRICLLSFIFFWFNVTSPLFFNIVLFLFFFHSDIGKKGYW